MKKSKIEDVVISTLTGVAGGAIIGLLFAPDKGSKTREKITKRSNDLLNGIKKRVNNTRESIKNNVETTKEELSEISENVKEKGEDLLDDSQKLTSYEDWTKEELYQRAKKEKISGYSTMNKDELFEALKNN